MAFTYFFRDIQTLDLVVAHVLPTLRGYRYIRIWDAGCAHGPEPYSIAILLRENMSHRNVRIHATDISGQFGQIIKEGVFPVGEVKRIPPAIRAKYFTEADTSGYCRIDDEIRASVSFARHDLLSLQPIRDGLGLIVCKNVLLHLSPAQRVDVIRMFHNSLREGGFLVMEQTQKLPGGTEDLFESVTCKAQVLRKLNGHATKRIAA
jgi:chemotaxis protein methyltransferase CheR